MASQSRKSQERDDADIRKAMANTRAGPEQAIPLSSGVFALPIRYAKGDCTDLHV